MHAYASDIENIKYMIWGPNSEDDTVEFLVECIENANKNPRKRYDFAVTLKDTGNVIGGCGIYLNDTLDEAMLGWTLHIRIIGRRYMTQQAKN